MVKGPTNPVFARQWNRLSALAPADYDPIAVAIHDNDNVPRALWVVESKQGQGTGFELQGYGLVTCEHCLDTSETVVYRADTPAIQYPVRVLSRSDHLDLAVLERPPEAPRGEVLVPGDSTNVTPPTPVELFGFPEYAPGASVVRNPTTITSRRKRLGVQLFTINSVVVHGASGGPAVDASSAVVGIIRTGYDDEQLAQPTLIDIAELNRL